jgi:hypothetical protein
MKRIYFSVLLLFVITLSTFAEPAPITVKPYGYVSYEVVYDTYRSVDTRDGQLYLFPKKPTFDVNGNDINKRSKLNMLSLQSRFGFRVSGPDAFGAKTSAVLEADFFATQQDYARLLRVRLASMWLKWETTELMMGHHFHPMFVLDCAPGTISFGAAAFFHPLNRAPQIRVTQKVASNLTASLSFLMHGYHSAAGPNDQQRNSGLPDSQFQLRFNPGNFLLGVTAGYKFLSPRDITNGGVATTKNVGSYNIQGFSKLTTDAVIIKVEGLIGENLSNYVMLGGYGALGTDTEENPFDWNADYDYANLKTLSLWTDIESNSKVWKVGFFGGYVENLGSSDPFLPIAGLSRWTDVHYVFRVSPRVSYHSNNFSLGFEWAYYSAVYTEEFDSFRKPIKSMDPAVNNHILAVARYTF